MDILQNSLPDDQFYDIQMKLKLWLKRNGFTTWKQIQKACRNLLASYPESYSAQYGKFPEYKLFMPLLRNGICEIAKENGKIGYVILPKIEENEDILDSLLLLNNFPCIKDLVATFKTDDTFELRFFCDLNDKYVYKPFSKSKLQIGIYKPEDKVYAPTFLYDCEKKREIPKYDENPDSINIARCFVRCYEKRRLFIYHQFSKKLNVHFYSELPILITRALILFDKSQIRKKAYSFPLSKDIPYHNIENNAINELVRIFGKNCIEVAND